MHLVSETTEDWPQAGEFEHFLMPGRGDDSFARVAVDFLAAGLQRGDAIAAAVPSVRFAVLRRAFGDDVALYDLSEASGRNPGRIIPLVLSGFADRYRGTRLRVLQESVWAGRTDLEYPACVQHEALTNLAFAGRPMTVACFYDTDALAPSVTADARATHPAVLGAGGSVGYAPAEIFARYNVPLPEPSHPISELRFDESTQELARDFAARSAAAANLALERRIDVELVTYELTANSIKHGGGSGRLRVWAEKEVLICEVADSGRLTDPLAGRRPAGLSINGGRGLFLVNCLADLIRVHNLPDGLVVRAYFAR